MRLLVLFLLVATALAGLRAAWIGPELDPWARVARRVRPLLLEIEDQLRAEGHTTDADRIAACTATVSRWEARL